MDSPSLTYESKRSSRKSATKGFVFRQIDEGSAQSHRSASQNSNGRNDEGINDDYGVNMAAKTDKQNSDSAAELPRESSADSRSSQRRRLSLLTDVHGANTKKVFIERQQTLSGYGHMSFEAMRRILETMPAMRTEADLLELVQMGERIKFFADLKLTKAHLKELMTCCYFETIKEGENVFDYGDEGDKFYIIIKGTCSVLIRNPKIREWYHQWIQYQKLLAWKEDKFDRRVEKVRQEKER